MSKLADGSPRRSLMRSRRRAMDVTQSELAKVAGLCTTTIHAIERGEATPDVDVAKRIADHLNSTIEELFLEDETSLQESSTR